MGAKKRGRVETTDAFESLYPAHCGQAYVDLEFSHCGAFL